jgi:hypothetical protein
VARGGHNLLNVSMEANGPVKQTLNSVLIKPTNFKCWCGNSDLDIFSAIISIAVLVQP